MHASTTLKAPFAQAHYLRRSSRFFGRHLWTPLTRTHPFRVLLRCLQALNVQTFHERHEKPLVARPLVVASGMTVGPVAASNSPSELSNGPLPSTLVLGELLGSGTFGEVFRGLDSESGQEVAVKVVSKKRQGSDPASMEIVKQRIEHEVSMWCELQSFPSADEERVYFVQELCNGGSLEDLMKIRGCLSEVEVAQIMKTVFSLAAFCHERGICYCDIKPANFILPSSVPGLCGDGSVGDFVKVIDFGSCEHVPKNGLRGEKGTPLYTAPEVYNSRYGVESDMWSAGVLMYYLLSGEIPFIGTPSKQLSPSALSFYLQFGELKFDAPVWEHISQEAKDLLTCLLERNVKKRMSGPEALEHIWMQHLVSGKGSEGVSKTTTTLSDICPMDSSVRNMEQETT